MAWPTFDETSAILDGPDGEAALRRRFAEEARADDPTVTDEVLDQRWRVFAMQCAIPIDGATSAVWTKPRR
jgi:hypothetical protein